MLLSACMLTLNEADHVRLSVPSIIDWVDELVVIDGGSTDGTIDILKSFGEKVRIEVINQDGDMYSKSWNQEERRENLQNLCQGDWVFSIDSDEVADEGFRHIRSILSSCDDATICFGVNRLDYAPDLYHGYMPYTAHPPIPRIWRRGEVTWLTGKVLHMHPNRTGTDTPINKFDQPIYVSTEHVLHHLHRAYWIGKNRHKIRRDDIRQRPFSRSDRLGGFPFNIDYVPREIVPKIIKKIRESQKKTLMSQLGVEDPFDLVKTDHASCDGQNFFLPGNARNLSSIIQRVPNPILFVEIGSWLGGSTRFLARKAGGCLIAIDHWLGSEEHQGRMELASTLPNLYRQFLINCYPYRDQILPIRRSSQEALMLPIANIDLLYIDGAHDYDSVLFDLNNWSERVSENGIICGDDFLWGADQPVARAVRKFASEKNYVVNNEGYFWWLDKKHV